MTKFILGIAVLCLGFIGQAHAQTPAFGTGSSNVALWCLNSGGTAWIPAGGAGGSCIGSGGGGGGGAVTAAAGSYVTGFSPDIGSSATTAWAGSGTPTVLGLLQGIYNSSTGATPAGANSIGTVGLNAGTNLVGKVGIDQTTVGTTNAVSLAQIGANTVSTGAGATGTGTQRVGVAQDTTTIAGAAPGTAGTASSNVLTVQGVASMTKLLVTPDSVALPANQSVNTAQVNGVTTLTGTGAVGTGSQRVAVGTDTATIAGSAPSTVLLANTTTPYPSTAVPITASATGTTAATTATLTNVSGHTTYICGLSIRANATAAATGNATVTGTITGTLNFTQWTAPNASGLGINEQVFAPCVPASAVSTSIAVISAAPGTGGVVSVTAWGYSI